MDIIFCGNNCGNDRNCAGDCASGTCLSKTDQMIMGANTYDEVLTVGGCDTNDRMVGYSSRGPSIAGMYQDKPDLVAYTHFLGSKTVGMDVPDTGVSLPARWRRVALLPYAPDLTRAPCLLLACSNLRDTAYLPSGGTGWDPWGFVTGIIKPVAAGVALGLPISKQISGR